MPFLEIVLIIAGVLLFLALLAWLGLHIKPAPFPAYPQKTTSIDTIPLPTGLPIPVERFYRKIFGERIPFIQTAVMTGRATLRPFGPLTLPGRFRFTHLLGQGYRHYIEATFFGIPILRVNERYLDRKSLIEIPIIGRSEGPKTEQAANLGMWAELFLIPSVLLTDPRVHWEPYSDESAVLVVPFRDNQERFIVRFHPETGLIRYAEVMRYQNENSTMKSLWITTSIEETWKNGFIVHSTGAATWFQDGKPWAFFTTEDIQYNIDIQDYIRAKGI